MTMISNTPRQHDVLRLEARRSFSLRVNVKDEAEDGTLTARDITGATVTLVIVEPAHHGGQTLLTKVADLVTPTDGYARLNVQSADLALPEGEYPFAIVYEEASGYSRTGRKGVVEILDNADPGQDNTYTGGTPPFELDIIIPV